jgi:LysM repeat protein
MKYKIQKGDTLIGLSKKHNLSLGDVLRANPGVDARGLQVGQMVNLPVAGSAAPAKPVAAAPVKPIKQIPLVKAPPADSRPVEPFTFDEFASMLAQIEGQYKLPAGLLAAMAFVESSGNPFAKNKGAKGMFQFTPVFLKDKKVKRLGTNIEDLARAPRAVAAYLAHSHNRLEDEPAVAYYRGHGWNRVWEVTAMSYTTGLTGVLRWLKSGAPSTPTGSIGEHSLSYPRKIAEIMQAGSPIELLRPGWARAFQPSEPILSPLPPEPFQ